MTPLTVLAPALSGTLEPASAPIFPSVPSPFIELNQFKVRNLRRSDGEDWYDCLCDIQVSGIVNCRVCDYIQGDKGTITKGIFTFNNSGRADAEFEIIATKEVSANPREPFPFKGTFCTEITGVRILGGNNTFQFTIESPIYEVQGFTAWVVLFRLPDEPSYFMDPDEQDLITEPSIVEGPSCLRSSGLGEFYPFYIAASEQDPDDFLTIQGKGFRVSESPFFPKCFLVSDRNYPVAFVIRPTCKTLNDDISLNELSRNQTTIPVDQRFYTGFRSGVLAPGAELICLNDGDVVPIQQGDEHFSYEVSVVRQKKSAAIGLRGWSPRGFEIQDISIPVILRKIWDASHDPKLSKDLPLTLISWDLDSLGIEGPNPGDWRSLILYSLSNFLSLFLEEYSEASELEVGYVLGRYVGEALRRNLNPAYPVQLQDDGVLRFYIDLLDDPFFSKDGYGFCARDRLESCVGAIRSAHQRAGRN